MARDESAPVPDPIVIDMLERWLEAARCGALQDIVMVGRFCDGEYNDDWQTADIGDMALELRSTVIRMQTHKEQIEATVDH